MSRVCYKRTWKDELFFYGFILFMCGLLFALIYFGVEKIEYYDNGVPTYFLEPDGYVIAEVSLDDGFFGHFLYGYILEEDYQSYLDGTLETLIVLNPYEEGKHISTTVNKIDFINVGEYEDYREYIK